MPSYTLNIDNWHPARLNELLGCHWAKAQRRKNLDARILHYECRKAGVPPATRKRRVSFVITLGKGQRTPDPDCYFKSMLDGLKRAGAIKDDSRGWVEFGMPVFMRGSKGTVIHLEDVEDDGSGAKPA